MERDSGPENPQYVKYKDDIDDNCPMTGDETDTEPFIYKNTLHLSDVENELKEISNEVNQSNILHSSNEEEIKKADKPDSTNQVLYDYDEEESFSSDRNFHSDEETSSVAGSYDDLGKDDGEDSLSECAVERNRQTKLQRLALRQHLDQLGELVVEKEYEVQQARDELQKCRDYLSKLEIDIKSVAEEIKRTEERNNKAAFYRLQNKCETLKTELEIEKEVEQKCLQNVEDAEFYLAQVYIEHAKFLPIDEELEEEEKNNEKIKAEKASARIKKEMTSAAVLERKKKMREKEHISAVRERERKNRQAVIAAKKNREVAMRYLKDTMSRVRQKESEEEDKYRKDLNKKMSVLLGLKRNIELDKENIKAVQAKENHDKLKYDTNELAERQKLIEKGENPDEVLTRRKRIRQFERDKEAFERKQREREIEIVNKIISEEKQMKKRYQQQPQLWPDNRPRRVPRRRSKPRFAPSSGSESMEYGADVEDTGGRLSYLKRVSTDEEGEFSPYGATCRDDDNDREETTEDDEKEKENILSKLEEDESFNEPEFKGLWEQDANQVPEEGASKKWKSNNKEYSKFENEMMKDVLAKQRYNIVQKQVAAGKEFKGCAFSSKPETIVFKDFDVGKKYKQKVLLTNVSYTQNYCQYIGVSDNLKDFIEVKFSPPGSLSAGLTCDLNVTFIPLINRDIDGHIEMIAQTGLFYIPVKCLIKRCQVSINTTEIEFENQVIGETRTKMVLLKNNGALSTSFSVKKIDEDGSCDESTETLSIEQADSRATSEDKSEAKKCIADREEEEEALNNTDGISLGQIKNGTLAPFSTISLKFVFAPSAANVYEDNFEISFSDKNVQTIIVKVKATAVDLPVLVEREVVDLKICMLDRLYQDAVIVSNRATYALRIRVEVPLELRNHLDMLPKTAYVQAESQFSIQLKFLPRPSIYDDAKNYICKESGLLQVPIIIRVADQTRPVPFSFSATVTSSDFQFDTKEVDFGYCTVNERVLKTIQLTNESVLPQQYGFVGSPDFIDVQPNDGFGSILPNDSIDIDLYFSPDKAMEYRFNILCKSHIGREFPLKCKGIGVLPPLMLSENLIKFRATSVNDTSTTHIFVINDHISTNQFTHSVPRIGSGDIFPVGPTSFEFIVPENAPLVISPTVGTVIPGQKCMVHVSFSPKIADGLIDRKTEELMMKLKNKKAEIENQETDPKDDKNKIKNQKNGKVQNGKAKNKPDSPVKALVSDKLEINRLDLERKSHVNLQRSFEHIFTSFKIPCFIAFGECGEPSLVNENNTLYLEVHCPAIRPSMIVVSEDGSNTVDFGKVALEQRHTRSISIQNITEDQIELTSSIIDPLGPFEFVNAFRTINPNEVQTMQLSFTPQSSESFYELLEVKSMNTTVSIRLKGQGIQPVIQLEPDDKFFDVGDVLVNDSVKVPLKITNTSELSMFFNMTLGSQSPFRHTRTQNLPATVAQYKNIADTSFIIGPSNYNGLCVFGCSPSQGTLEPGESKEVMISFSPDHPSELYRDELSIAVNGVEEFMNIHIVGRCWPTIIYSRGWDRLTPTEESLAPQLFNKKVENNDLNKTVLLSLYTTFVDGKFTVAEHSIEFGCIKSSIQTKKSCDFVFENMKEALEEGFNIDPLKGGVDIGARKTITISWKPKQTFDPQQKAQSTVQFIMRGDSNITYKVVLCGYMKSLEP